MNAPNDQDQRPHLWGRCQRNEHIAHFYSLTPDQIRIFYALLKQAIAMKDGFWDQRNLIEAWSQIHSYQRCELDKPNSLQDHNRLNFLLDEICLFHEEFVNAVEYILGSCGGVEWIVFWNTILGEAGYSVWYYLRLSGISFWLNHAEGVRDDAQKFHEKAYTRAKELDEIHPHRLLASFSYARFRRAAFGFRQEARDILTQAINEAATYIPGAPLDGRQECLMETLREELRKCDYVPMDQQPPPVYMPLFDPQGLYYIIYPQQYAPY